MAGFLRLSGRSADDTWMALRHRTDTGAPPARLS
jgi:hypothetical protein